jgi:transforming growth factor-beta-induced protein
MIRSPIRSTMRSLLRCTHRSVAVPHRANWRPAALALGALLAVPCLTPVSLSAQHTARASNGNSSRNGAALPSIPQVAINAGQFNTLLAAVQAAGLTETLLGRGPFTLFAPTDEAFARLPKNTVADLLKPENREQLRTLLTYHVLSGRVTAAQARDTRSARTVAGPAVRITSDNNTLRINDATVRIADVPASNGVVHIIDRVLMPSSALGETAKGAVALVDYAVERGASLFNDGDEAASVAVYEVAITALLSLGSPSRNGDEAEGLASDVQRSLRNALRDRDRSARSRAVALRRALDDARRSISGEMVASNR